MHSKIHLTICLLLHIVVKCTVAIRCDREPEGHTSEKSEVNNRFKIRISGNPDKYVPGEKYLVNLQGERNQQFPHKFTGFMLVVEPINGYIPSPDSYLKGPLHDDYIHRNVGTFSLYGDTLTRFSDHCPNAVIQTSSLPKSDIQVLWKAPPQGSGCVVFRATVVESRDHWFMDDGPLSHVLCEAVQDNDDDQPEIVKSCCACDEAKYEVTFEGLWSRHTHPKDFPTNGWLTRFSDVIGASHSVGYRFWDYGKTASEGLRQVAERGSTRMLESELKAESEHIRTIIKARGISYPNVTGKTFAVFRVDSKHHLMSIVSMIDPSPDWIVGVSGLELCLRNCSWIEHKVLNLYPWDAGTDNGITYISHDMPSTPREPIRRITSSFPNDPRSPFFDPSGDEMKPLARLYLTRQRLYEKSCSEDGDGSETEEDPVEHIECQVTEWDSWSACSVTCGKGVKYRQRFYVDNMKAGMKSCNVKLTSKHVCMGLQETCGPQGNDDTEQATLNPICAVTDWTPWSGCSSTCGRGVRMRTRKYVSLYGHKRCSHLHNAPILEQTDECEAGDRMTCGDSIEDSQEGENCPMTEWSRWSPCSVTCGKGKRLRTRLRAAYNEDTMLMYEHMDEGYGPLSMRDCEDVLTKEEVDCQAAVPSCEISRSEARGICQMPKEEGPCSGNHTRWFFDAQSGSCQEFMYSGCRGNRNNFESIEECEETCKEYKEDESYGEDGATTINPNFSDLRVLNSISETAGPSTDMDGTDDLVVDCELTRWSGWSECSATCGRGYRTRTRTIKVHARNGGKPCPRKLTRRKKCKRACSSDGVPDVNPTWGEAKPPNKVPSIDCLLSEWTPWSPCSVTCGVNAAQQRTRSILRPSSGGGIPCDIRLEINLCELLPCSD